MENFIFAFNAIAPMFFIMGVGYILRRVGVLSENFVSVGSHFTFHVAIPMMLFMRMATTDISKTFSGKLIMIGVVSAVGVAALAMLFSRFLTDDKSKKGVFVQASFRSNLAIFGVYLVEQVGGDGASDAAAMMIGLSVPLFTILAVIIFSIYGGGEKKVTVKSVTWDTIKNPFVVAVLIGVAVNLLHIRVPDVLSQPISAIGDCTSPVGLLTLGAQFDFKKLSKNFKLLTAATLVRTVIVPALVLIPAAFMGIRGAEMATLLAFSGSPASVSSYVTAGELGGDSELAGQVVVSTTLFSLVTMFFILSALKSFGLV